SNVEKTRSIHRWCLKYWEVKFRHIQEEANRVADCIAKADGGMMDQFVIFLEPPRYVRELLEYDIRQLLLVTDRSH
ncbi:hypothetical protein Goklo_016183, partial [Gossypium klotzschianum]|nr:hypothetical protein [Gossypium klotzschianum]